ncbi:LGFP repeat-containing protein [Microbacterium sp.]|uniref:LGFP repeat-containing protein n=1 Tax=Microbacterium sp. TaxID=51671 RepID=UPI003C773DBF
MLAMFVVVAAVMGCLAAVVPPAAPAAVAASAGDFDAGYLISDRNFFDSQSMTADEVQSFLSSKVNSCPASAGMPCLKDYTAHSTPAMQADAYCAAYAGGTMSAAQLIVSVSQACDINPKVMLVMLQKEQGLVTATSPTPRNYSAALGQGCPDGAECDPNYAGFFYQVYGAARQFQIYIKSPKLFAYQVGWNSILYQATPPDWDRICGTKQVYIQNDATRALYIYTPYTPNQAALDNLYGTGDFCSSYGNRNFWRLYTDWFGDPVGELVTGEYADAWRALGGSDGILGSPTGDVTCIDDRYCQQSFRGGTVFWFPARGVFGVPTTIESIWRSLGFIDGEAGMPTDVVVCNPDSTCVQSFDGGAIAADSGGGSLVGRHVESAWLDAGGIALGGARGPEVCSDGENCAQEFARGAFFTGPLTISVTGAIFGVWSASGKASGSMGYPVDNAVCTSAGCTQQFGGGIIVSSGENTEAVPTVIADKYLSLGGLSALGAPVTPASCDAAGACAQRFTSARIDTSPTRGAIATTTWFFDAWGARGYEQGPLGLPLSEATCSPVTCMQEFEGGILTGSPYNGVVAVNGEYRDVWMASGGPTGSLGLPLEGDSCNGQWCSMPFERGVVIWSPSTGARSVVEPILSSWNAAGGAAGTYGLPTGPPSEHSTGVSQPFQGGPISATR